MKHGNEFMVRKLINTAAVLATFLGLALSDVGLGLAARHGKHRNTIVPGIANGAFPLLSALIQNGEYCSLIPRLEKRTFNGEFDVWVGDRTFSTLSTVNARPTTNSATPPVVVNDPITYTYDSLNRLISVTEADGSSITYTYDAAGNRIAHQVTGASTSANTIAGNNVSVEGNGVIARFATVTSGGTTSIAPINPTSVSELPNGFQLFADGSAFNISTTAVTQGTIGVCFNGYFNMDPTTFSRLRLLHNENGIWVNRTTSSDSSTGLICSNVSSAGQFAMVLLGPPTALVDETSGRAAALDSVTFVRDPVPVIDPTNFSIDQRARLAFFVMSVDLLPAESPSLVTAQAEDAQHLVYPLTVESVAKVPNADWLTEVIVKLPDSLIGKGDVQVSVTVRGIKSEKVAVRIQ